METPGKRGYVWTSPIVRERSISHTLQPNRNIIEFYDKVSSENIQLRDARENYLFFHVFFCLNKIC